MDAGTSTLNPPFEAGPSAAPGEARTHGPSAGGSTPVMPEEQTHHKPFFYVQPPQSFLPVQSAQWPLPLALPLSYSPHYGGYPAFGYGLPLMPHFQPSPFMEGPGFVVPHTHLHLMDYRRLLNPQYYQSMAYHARRLRYQQNVPPRDVISAEVQTEPWTSPMSSNQSGTSNKSPNLSTAVSVQKDDHTMALNELAPSSSNATPQKGSFVIETEEVRIQCCATPTGLQVLHAHESSDMSRRFAQDVVHCSSVVQNSLLAEENSQTLNTEGDPEQSCQACPDILIVATPSGTGKNLRTETTPTNQRIKMAAIVDPIPNEEDLKVVRLPFDAKYLDELCRTESAVWSADDTLVPSPDFIIESLDETLRGEASSVETLVTRKELAQEEVVQILHKPKATAEDLEAVGSTLENHTEKMTREEVPKQAYVTGKMESGYSRNLLSDDSVMDGALQDRQDTSFESLPAYLPSTSWLADFENTSNSKMAVHRLRREMGNRSLDVPVRRRKLDSEFKEVSAIRKPKERCKLTGKTDWRSMSDHECCVGRSYNENEYISKAQQLCTRCSSKQSAYKTSTGPTPVSKRKFTPFQPRNDLFLPTCDACKGHVGKRFVTKGSSSDARIETEPESLENSSRRKMMEEMKRPLAMKRNMEKCPVTCSKLRERNFLCGDLQQPLQSKWQRIYHCPHGNAIRGTDENCEATLSPEPWRSREQVFLAHRWHTEKPWRTMPGHNTESLKIDLLRAPHTNLHKKSLPPPQGVHRKDTRC